MKNLVWILVLVLAGFVVYMNCRNTEDNNQEGYTSIPSTPSSSVEYIENNEPEYVSPSELEDAAYYSEGVGAGTYGFGRFGTTFMA